MTICDECTKEVDDDDASTCSCGLVVCDECTESKHYRCNDPEPSPGADR